MADQRPGVTEGPVVLDLVENGYLVMAVWDRAKQGDATARSIYDKLKQHAINCGVVWYYGDPWDREEPHPHG